jgi:Flp pilus assembly pilin Flp
MPKESQLRPIMALLRARLAADEQGATAIEYALIASGVGAAVAATVYNLVVRFHVSNPIKRLFRACRTKCGRRDFD